MVKHTLSKFRLNGPTQRYAWSTLSAFFQPSAHIVQTQDPEVSANWHLHLLSIEGVVAKVQQQCF